MAKCTVTLNIARLGSAYGGKSVAISDVEARNDGVYWTTTENQLVPLTNSSPASVQLDRATAYRFLLPDGSSSVRLVPDTEEALFSELTVLYDVSAKPVVLALEPDVFVETEAVENDWIDIGDYLMVDNPGSPDHGNLYQKTS